MDTDTLGAVHSSGPSKRNHRWVCFRRKSRLACGSGGLIPPAASPEPSGDAVGFGVTLGAVIALAGHLLIWDSAFTSFLRREKSQLKRLLSELPTDEQLDAIEQAGINRIQQLFAGKYPRYPGVVELDEQRLA